MLAMHTANKLTQHPTAMFAMFTNQRRKLYNLCYNAMKSNGESTSDLRQWLRYNKKNKKLLKEAAAYKHDDGNTPLHRILHMHRPPLDVVRILIEHAPETAQMKNHFEMLPLHYACLNGSSLEVLNPVIQAYPESIHEKDGKGKKPSFYLKRWSYHMKKNGNMQLKLLHNASAGEFSSHLVKLLVEAFPKSCMIQDANGMIPLHYACANNEANSMEVVMILLNKYPESCVVTDNLGRTPPKLLKHLASQKDKNGMLPLHHQARSSKSFTTCALSLLFSAYPESMELPDYHGMLPFHHACLNENLPVDVLLQFVKLFPESIIRR